MSKKGKIILTVSIIAVFLICLIPVIIFATSGNKDVKVLSNMTLEKKSITNTISANGTVESADSHKIYTTLTYPVKDIPVKLGDTVKKGDTLAILDSKDLEKQIKIKESSLDVSNTSSYYTLKTAEDTYMNLKNSVDSGLNDSMNTAQSNYDTAKSALEVAQKNYDDKIKDINSMRDSQLVDLNLKLEQAYNSVKALEAEYEKQKESLSSDTRDSIASAEKMITITRKDKNENPTQSNKNRYDNYYKELTKLLPADILQTRTSLESAYFSYDSTTLAIESRKRALDTELENTENQLDTAKRSFESAKKALESGKVNVNQQLETAKNNYEQALKNVSNDPQVLELSNMKSNLLDCTITSPIDGTVTSIAAVEGTVSQGVILTVDDTNTLKINANIKEYDIKSIKKGMKVIITSDATEDEEYQGVVSNVAPAGVKDQTNGQINFPIEVEVTSKDTGLLIGTNTKLKIICEEVNDAFGVPFGTVVTTPDGKDVVYVANKSGSDYKLEEVPVEVGLETDLEMQIISDKLTDGTILITDTDNVKDGDIITLKKKFTKVEKTEKE
ncbi:MAG TPA: efflux RND transporter periplasmic adaptor subunit [Oscillospiraceae bacterium]|nr:efflux RND transporter periplasmic adaptor subunit [Oscillospiraceae bacterium]